MALIKTFRVASKSSVTISNEAIFLSTSYSSIGMGSPFCRALNISASS